AMAPPRTFILSGAIANSLAKAIGTTAKASLTSQRSTSRTPQPAFSSAFRAAATGAVVNQAGSCAYEPTEMILAIALQPRALAVSSQASTSAAAPSLMLEALAAVIV